MKKILYIYLMFFIILLTSCTNNLKQYTKRIWAMDTIIEVSIYTDNEPTILFKEIEDIYKLYTMYSDMYNEYSGIVNVCTINKEKNCVVSKELYDLLKYSLDMKNKTFGYFEPLIGNITLLWKNSVIHNDNPTIPNEDEISNQLNIIKSSSLTLNDDYSVTLSGDAIIDLGGVAKGYATEVVYKHLKSKNITNFLVNAGSSNVVLSTKPKNEAFKIGLKDMANGYFNILEIKNKAVVTSSYREQHKIIDNKLYTHIINPITGYTSNNYQSLTLIGDDSAMLDVYSTALYCMDLEQIKEFVIDNNLTIIIYNNDKVLYSNYEKDN